MYDGAESYASSPSFHPCKVPESLQCSLLAYVLAHVWVIVMFTGRWTGPALALPNMFS